MKMVKVIDLQLVISLIFHHGFPILESQAHSGVSNDHLV